MCHEIIAEWARLVLDWNTSIGTSTKVGPSQAVPVLMWSHRPIIARLRRSAIKKALEAGGSWVGGSDTSLFVTSLRQP